MKQRAQDGKFKVPTLRNIARTAPYMHNGYFKTLRGVVAFYNDRERSPPARAMSARPGRWPKPEIRRNLNNDEMGKLGLSEQEVDDIVAFMLTLNDE